MQETSTSICCLLITLFLLLPYHVDSEALYDQEQEILIGLKQHWQNPPSLNHWTPSGSSHWSWPEVACINGSIAELHLGEKDLTGSIPPFVCDLKNLTFLDFFKNSIVGMFPSSLLNCSNPVYLNLGQNYFIVAIPNDIDRLAHLSYIDLSCNNFSGNVPAAIGRLPELKILELCQNEFNGTFPPEIGNLSRLEVLCMEINGFLPSRLPSNFTRLKNLKELWLSETNLIGDIAEMIGDMAALKKFDLSRNHLTGNIPSGLFMLKNLKIQYLCKNRLSGAIPQVIDSLKLTTLNRSENNLSGQIPNEILSLPDLLELDLSENQISGKIRAPIGFLKLTHLNLSSNDLSGKIPGEYENTAYSGSFLNNSGPCANSLFLNIHPCNSEPQKSSKISTKVLVLMVSALFSVFVITLSLSFCLTRTYRIWKCALGSTWTVTSYYSTMVTETIILPGLKECNIIETGGSGKVYKVSLNNSGGDFVAVKRMQNCTGLDQKLEKEFQAEVQIMSRIRHLNIVKLLCCISNDNTKLLVYEYLENNSLDRWLHKKKSSTGFSVWVRPFALDWPKRSKIALGAAQGLSYMHNDCVAQVIHGDVKSSNILLDCEFNAKIGDFGLARVLSKRGDCTTVSAVAGSFGYMAPEFSQTRKVNEKTDVYSFGVVLLELTTGKKAISIVEDSCLADWAWRHKLEGRPIKDALDKEIKEPYYFDEMTGVFELGLQCTRRSPSDRPSMKEVLQILFDCSH